jgi:hypothetical protein
MLFPQADSRHWRTAIKTSGLRSRNVGFTEKLTVQPENEVRSAHWLKSQITVFGIKKTANNFLIAGFSIYLNLTMKAI